MGSADSSREVFQQSRTNLVLEGSNVTGLYQAACSTIFELFWWACTVRNAAPVAWGMEICI